MQGTAAASGWLGDADNGAPVGLFRAHFDNLPGPSYIWQRCSADDFRLIAHNRAAARLGNGEIRGLLGVRTSELFKNRPDIRATIVQSARHREITVQETDMQLVSGTTRRMRATLLPMSNDIVVAHLEDVTEQRAAEDALRASERRFRALFQSHPDVTFRMDVVGNYLDMHVPEGAVASMHPADVVGKNIGDLFGADAAASHSHYARETIRTDTVQVLEYDVRIEGRDTRVEARMVRSGDDEVVVTVRDITNEVDVEQSVAAARDRERRQLGQALQNQLKEVRLRLDDLSSAAAASAPDSPPEGTAALADRLAALETAVGNAHEIAYDLDPVTAGTPLIDALRSFVARSEQRFGISLRLSCSDSVPPLHEQVADLHRIVQEAVANAVEHGAAKNVEIICSAINGQLIVNVADDGTGFRLSASDNAAYGMRVIRHRTKRLGGTLLRSRRSAGGTLLTFTCALPRNGAAAK
jgi:PAS domain S-box-containing protein